MLEPRIQQQFFDSADLLVQQSETLSRPLAQAADLMVVAITSGARVYAAGAGASMADAQQAAASLAGGWSRERPGVPALALGTDPVWSSAAGGLLSPLPAAGAEAEPGVTQPMVRQLQALAQPGDVLVLFDAAGRLAPLARAAREQDMAIVLLGGPAATATSEALTDTDVHLAIEARRASHLSLMHRQCWLALCDAIDLQLLGETE